MLKTKLQEEILRNPQEMELLKPLVQAETSQISQEMEFLNQN